MKVGDLVRALDKVCEKNENDDCGCWFCFHDSGRIGIVISQVNKSIRHSNSYWNIQFDSGEWRLYGSEVEVLSRPNSM